MVKEELLYSSDKRAKSLVGKGNKRMIGDGLKEWIGRVWDRCDTDQRGAESDRNDSVPGLAVPVYAFEGEEVC